MEFIRDLISVPFGYVMDILYRLTSNYGLSVILFSVIASLAMLPIHMYTSLNAAKKSAVFPVVQAIRNRYPGNMAMQNRLVEELYKKEKVDAAAGCCFISIIPTIIILGALFSVMSQPIVYMFHESKETATELIAFMKELNPEMFAGGYPQVAIMKNIHLYVEQVKAAFPNLQEQTLNGINYSFIGLDLAMRPNLNIAAWDTISWSNIGLLLLPILASTANAIPKFIRYCTTMLRSFIDKSVEAPKSTLTNNLGTTAFTAITTLMFIYACFFVPGAMSLYWLTNSIMKMVTSVYIKKRIAKLPLAKTTIDDLDHAPIVDSEK